MSEIRWLQAAVMTAAILHFEDHEAILAETEQTDFDDPYCWTVIKAAIEANQDPSGRENPFLATHRILRRWGVHEREQDAGRLFEVAPYVDLRTAHGVEHAARLHQLVRARLVNCQLAHAIHAIGEGQDPDQVLARLCALEAS